MIVLILLLYRLYVFYNYIKILSLTLHRERMIAIEFLENSKK